MIIFGFVSILARAEAPERFRAPEYPDKHECFPALSRNDSFDDIALASRLVTTSVGLRGRAVRFRTPVLSRPFARAPQA
jgi:hypothetical protein